MQSSGHHSMGVSAVGLESINYGHGYGYGSGSGNGNGYGSGYGSGYGDGSGYGYGLDHEVEITPTRVIIGCQDHSIEYWLANGERIGEEHGVSPIAIGLLLHHIKSIADKR